MAGTGLALSDDAAGLTLRLSGRLDAAGAGAVWQPAFAALRRRGDRPVTVDLADASYCDMGGAAFLASLEAAHPGRTEFRNLSDAAAVLLDRARAAGRAAPTSAPPHTGWGISIAEIMTAVLGGIGFLGQVAVAVVRLPRRRRMFRLPDLLTQVEQVGTRSLPLIVLLGYLMGLILAFQSAIPMRRFGAEIFVANLVSVSLLRELGALLAAVILAGRTASAFAAEIGTMKVNEELDALASMGLDPTTMLVLPRLLAAILVTPVMTLVLDVAGLAGMATVMQWLGFPIATIARQVQLLARPADLLSGLFKAVCFGAAVAAIGCRAGMATGVGPRAVGLSATAAVVGGIVATILLDGLFALMFFRLGL